MGLKLDYWPRPTKFGMEQDPIVGVTFFNPPKGKSVDIDCLIDSGADDILLHAGFAEILEIDLESGEERNYQGIGEHPVKGYVHQLKMKLRGGSKEYLVSCAFMPGLKRAGLLGQKGFFDNYKVVFERKKQRVEITEL